jgi:hypothetical protein
MNGRIGRLSRRMRRRRSKRLAVAAAVLLVVGALTMVIAPPAMAGCAKRFENGALQAEVDNCPGNRAASWAWVWNGYGGRDSWAVLDIRFTNGWQTTLQTCRGYCANSASYWSKWGYTHIRSVRLCSVRPGVPFGSSCKEFRVS